MRRRSFLAGTIASVGVAGLSGCAEDLPGVPGSEPTVEPESRGRRYKGEIVVATFESAPPAVQEALATAYRRFQPGVRIRWETQDWPDETTYASWLATRLADPTDRPDIISGSHLPDFSTYVDLEEYRWRTNPYTRNAWNRDFLFSRSGTFNSIGRRIGIGTEALAVSWFYNRQVFDDLGLEPPRAWEDLVGVCQAIEAAGVVPIAADIDDVVARWLAPVYFDQFHVDWAEAVRAQQGDWNWDPRVDPEFSYDATDPKLHVKYTFSPQRFYQGLRSGRLRFDTNELAELMANLAEVFPRFVDPEVLTGEDDQYASFLQGRSAMMLDGSWSLARLQRDLEEPTDERLAKIGLSAGSVQPFEWDVFGFPPMLSPSVQSAQVRAPEGTTGYELCVVDKGADNTAMVMDFLMYWLSAPGYTVFVEAQEETGDWIPQGRPLVADVTYPSHQELLDRAEQGSSCAAYGGFWVSGRCGGDDHGGGFGVGYGAGVGPAAEALEDLFRQAIQGAVRPTDYGRELQRYVQQNFAAFLRVAGLTADDLDNPARRPLSL